MKRLVCLVPLTLLLASCAPSQVASFLSGSPSSSPSGGTDFGTAVAQSYTPTQTGWVYKFLFLDEGSRISACNTGYASASSAQADQPGEVRFTSTEGAVIVDTSYGQTYDTCRQIGLKAGAKPDSVPLQGPGFFVYYKNYVGSDSRAAAVAFYDASGNEVYRYGIFDSDDSYKYYSNPPSGYALAFGVSLNTSAFGVTQKSAIARAESMRVQVNFGKGIETFTVSKAKFPSLQ